MASNPNQLSPNWRLRPNERRSTLIFIDLILSILALGVSLYFWSQGPEWYNFSWKFLQERVPFWFYLLPLIWMILLIESYNPRYVNSRINSFREVSIAAAAAVIGYLVLFFVSDTSLPRRGVAIFIACAYVFTLLWRFLYIKIFTTPQFSRRVLIVGAGRAGNEMARIAKGMWPPPFYLVGLIDDDPNKLNTEVYGFPVIGNSEQLFDIITENRITDLIFAISGETNPKLFGALLEAEEKGIEVTSMPVVYEDLLGRLPIYLLQPDWVLRSFVDQVHIGGFYELSKRLLDLTGGLVGSLILAFFFPFIGLLILLDSGFPIFYTQNRLGKNGRVYKMIKFRTMRTDAEKDGKPRPASENDDRATRVGRILRKTHLDELPQFINILRGDMSLVGPRSERPELVEELQKQIPFYRARLFARPGLTGWAQVNYGYASDVDSNSIKLEYDLYYIKHRNMLLDINIMFRTIGTVVGFRGR